MVVTFRAGEGGAARLFEAPTMAVASSMLPEGAYTTLRTYGGMNVVRLRDHLRRLTDSLEERAGPHSVEDGSVRRLIAKVLRDTGHAESRLRLTLAPPDLFLSVEEFTPLPRSLYDEGVQCTTVPLRRANPQAKDTRFVPEAERAYRRLPMGVHEGLLVSEDGAILEGLSSNFFAWREAALRTEEERALHGITRAMVLEVAAATVPVVREAVGVSELPGVAECFLTSVSRGILPVVGIDGTRVGTGSPGPVTRRLSELFDELVEREAESVG